MARTLRLVLLALIALLLTPSAAFALPAACRATGEVATAGGFQSALAEGPLLAALTAYLGGLVVSLTPCVYPMVAITVSIFGAAGAQKRSRGIALSATYVAGIVAMFVPLGVVAGLTGGLFGELLQNRWLLLGLALLFIAMASSLFGAFEMVLPSSLANRLSSVGGVGFRGAFALGLVGGIIAAPCTGPVLTGILTWIAQSQSALLGAGAMGAFALGLGTPFFAVGAFAVSLPKTGAWMLHVKSLLGIVLLVVAFYYVQLAFPQLFTAIPAGKVALGAFGAMTLAGLALGAIHLDFHGTLGERLRKGTGVFLTTAGSVLFLHALAAPSDALAWATMPLAEAQNLAKSSGKPLIVDVGAEWCGACKKLERETFADDKVQTEASRFLAVRFDATDANSPAVEKLMSDLKIVGLPTVALFDSHGEERIRCTDFVSPADFLEVLRTVQ